MRHDDRGRWTVIATALVVLGWSCASPQEEHATIETETSRSVSQIRREPGLDVLLITIDTLRADALGSYGKAQAGTPWMDQLAAAGVRFEDAHAHNVLTLPSHGNILSGRYPQEHGVRDNSGFRFPPSVPTLATLLRQQGYRTAAFVSAFPLDSRFGLARGFDVYEDGFVDATSRSAFLQQERAGTETVELATRWLSAADPSDRRPSFCWVHLYEPHFPYEPPSPFDRTFASDTYQGEVAATDSALEPLLEPLLRAGRAADSLVVLTSDHGEALGEHGEATHGIFAYESVLKVPLILFQPRLFGPRIVSHPVRHIDLLPTILDAVSLPVPAGLEGRSLLPEAAGVARDLDAQQGPASYFEVLSIQLTRGWAPVYGLIQAGRKFIDLPLPELYDLRSDPSEQRNLVRSQPQWLPDLKAELARLEALGSSGVAVSEVESPEVRERLEALGYVTIESSAEVSALRSKESYTEADDPKRLIELDRMQREITELYASGRVDQALRRARELVARRPGMRLAWVDLAQLERHRGNLDRAIEALDQALALAPSDPVSLALLATCLTQAGEPETAVERTTSHSLASNPDIDVMFARALALAKLGRTQQALATVDRVSVADPTNPRVPLHRGTVFLMSGQRSEAAAAYRRAVELNANTAAAHVSLAVMASEDGRPADALVHWRSALEADPGQASKLLAIGSRLWAASRTADARPLLELFVAAADADMFGPQIDKVRQILSSPAAS